MIGGRGKGRRSAWLGGLAVAAAAFGISFLQVEPAPAGAAGGTVTPVFSQELPNVPGNSLTAVLVEYGPGGASGAHRHAGSVFAFVVEGAIRSKLDDGEEIVYQAGQSFFEPPGTHHAVSANASETEPAKLLAVFVAETGAVPTVFDQE